MGKNIEGGPSLSLDSELTAGGICGEKEHPKPHDRVPRTGQEDPDRVGQDVYDPDNPGAPNTICSR